MFYLFEKEMGKNFTGCIEVFDSMVEVRFYLEANKSRLPLNMAVLEGEPRLMVVGGIEHNIESDYSTFKRLK